MALVSILMLICDPSFCQKRKPVSLKKKPAASKKAPKQKAPAGPENKDWFYVAELMAGKLSPSNSGSYFDFQRQYYQTRNPAFTITGDFPQQKAWYLGASIHAGIQLSNPVIRFISAGLSLSWTNRSLEHQVRFTNSDFKYRNQISISEQYKAQYLSPEFQLRFGSKVYGLLGIRRETLLNGTRKRTLRIESDSVQAGQPLEMTDQWNLKNSELVRQYNWGFHGAIGYMPLPWIGLRAGYMYTGTFFSSGPDFSTKHFYLALCLVYIKKS